MNQTFVSVKDKPDMLKQWDFDRNKVDPSNVHSGSGKKYYWVCNQKHSFLDTASHRKEGRGCPVCSGRQLVKGFNDLETVHPELVKQWNNKNNSLPSDYLPGSNIKVWWRCDNDHEWEAEIYSRTKQQNGCPYCSGRYPIVGENDLETMHPIIALEWHPNKNHNLKPNQVKEKSNKKVWWQCSKGHEWEARISNRIVSRTNCPICSSELRTSFPEQSIFYYLSKLIERVDSRFIIDKKGTEIDIYLPSLKIGIEYNGHYYHKNKKRDQEKLEFIESSGIRIFRIIEGTKQTSSQRFNDIFLQYPVTFKNLDMAIYELVFKLGEFIEFGNDLVINTEKDRMEIYSNYLSSEKNNSILNTHPMVANRWDYERNYPLKPSQVSSGSQRKHWWICDKGHSYEDTVSHQTNNRKCPICSGKKVLKGFNDLQTINPVLSEEWNFPKNILRPDQVTAGSNRKVWWKCKNGHEWKAIINNRTKGNGCPYCSGSKVISGVNDLKTLYPKLCEELHPDKNKEFNPLKVKPGTHKKIWWICENGHEWEASISNRVRGRGCPVCSNKKIMKGINDLGTINPDLIKEWNFEKNEISPDEISPKSYKKVWWLCERGHEWLTSVSHRANGTGCPICFSERRKKD